MNKDQEYKVSLHGLDKGLDIGTTNLGLCMLTYMYLQFKREGTRKFDRRKVFWWCNWLIIKHDIGAYRYGTVSTKKNIIKIVIEYYENKKHPKPSANANVKVKDIQIDDYGFIYWFYMYFTKMEILKEGEKVESEEWVKIDHNIILDFIRDDHEQITPYFIMSVEDQSKRVFSDPQVDYFYQQMKENFNYFKVMLEIGIPEKDIEAFATLDKINGVTNRYPEAIKRARKFIDMEVEAQNIKAAMAGDDNASINTYMRQRQLREKEEMDDVDEFGGGLVEKKVYRKPREEEITIET